MKTPFCATAAAVVGVFATGVVAILPAAVHASSVVTAQVGDECIPR